MTVLFFAVCAEQAIEKISKDSLSQLSMMQLFIQDVTSTDEIYQDGEHTEDLTTWNNVYLMNDGNVLQIHWYRHNLEGEIRLEWLPNTINEVLLQENSLGGTVCLTKLPDMLETLNLQNNNFCGTLDLSSLPSYMRELFLGCNSFSGSADFSKLPEYLQEIDVACNSKLSGKITISKEKHALLNCSVEKSKVNVSRA